MRGSEVFFNPCKLSFLSDFLILVRSDLRNHFLEIISFLHEDSFLLHVSLFYSLLLELHPLANFFPSFSVFSHWILLSFLLDSVIVPCLFLCLFSSLSKCISPYSINLPNRSIIKVWQLWQTDCQGPSVLRYLSEHWIPSEIEAEQSCELREELKDTIRLFYDVVTCIKGSELWALKSSCKSLVLRDDVMANIKILEL